MIQKALFKQRLVVVAGQPGEVRQVFFGEAQSLDPFDEGTQASHDRVSAAKRMLAKENAENGLTVRDAPPSNRSRPL